MIFISILKFIVVKALPLYKFLLFSLKGISAILFIYAGVLSLNTLNIQSIGSGIGIYSGLFQNNHELVSLGILINNNYFSKICISKNRFNKKLNLVSIFANINCTHTSSILSINLINIIKKYFRNIYINNDIKYSFLFGIILDRLNIDTNNLSSDVDLVHSLSLGVFIISLVSLLCFMNVIGYLISIILIQKFDVENKFPRFKKIIKYFENSSLIIVVIEGVICLISLLTLIVITLLIITK